jgi:hypothetical protein
VPVIRTSVAPPVDPTVGEIDATDAGMTGVTVVGAAGDAGVGEEDPHAVMRPARTSTIVSVAVRMGVT